MATRQNIDFTGPAVSITDDPVNNKFIVTVSGGTPSDGSVTTAKLANGAVTAAKVAADVATQAELDAHAVDTTAVLSDVGKVIEMNNASANTVTIPANVFTAGDWFMVRQVGTGATSVAQGSGATQLPSTPTAVSGQWKSLSIHFRGTSGLSSAYVVE